MRTSIRFKFLFFAIVTSVSYAHAANICWITQVQKTSDKDILVRFTERGHYEIAIGNPPYTGVFPRKCIVKQGKVMCGGEQEADALNLTIDQKVLIWQNHNDSCTLLVVTQDGRVGIQAEVYFKMHGLPPNTSKEFIEAQ